MKVKKVKNIKATMTFRNDEGHIETPLVKQWERDDKTELGGSYKKVFGLTFTPGKNNRMIVTGSKKGMNAFRRWQSQNGARVSFSIAKKGK